MAKEIPNLVAEARTGTGKGAARQARREGKVPGIVYGDHKDPIAIQFDFNKLLTTLRAGRFMSTLWNLQVPGQEDVRVICRGVQKDVVKDLPTHIDLMRLRRTTKVNLFIHVDFVNAEASPGLKRGAVLNIVRHELDLVCDADHIPSEIQIDVTGLDVGDSIHISEVTLPKGVTSAITDRDFTIATLVAPSALKSSEGDTTQADVA